MMWTLLLMWGSLTVVLAFLAWVDGREAAWRTRVQQSLWTKRQRH